MLILHVVRRMIPLGIAMLAPLTAHAQNYPTKPIRIFCSEIGGANDFAARLIGQGISGPLGQQVIVENRPQLIAAEIVAKTPPDGYTLMLGSGTFTFSPLLRETQYDPIRDFAPITLATSAPALLVVHPSLPVKTVKDLIALARAKPGELNYGSGASGGAAHITGEMLKSMAHIDIVRIPYKGDGPAMTGVIRGEVQVMFPTASSVLPHLKSNRLKALAVASAQPSALLPGMPTVAAAGLPGFESGTLVGILAPVKTPSAIITRLNQEIVLILNKVEVREKFLSMGVETIASSPEVLAATMKAEIARLSKVIREAGIRAD